MLLGGYRNLCVLLVLAASVLVAGAQSTMGSLRGVVDDATGAAIPDASATLRSVDQNGVFTLTSDNTGSFVFQNLKPGHYVLTVTRDGFAPTTIKDITLDARQDLRVTATLNVSAQTHEHRRNDGTRPNQHGGRNDRRLA